MSSARLRLGSGWAGTTLKLRGTCSTNLWTHVPCEGAHAAPSCGCIVGPSPASRQVEACAPLAALTHCAGCLPGLLPTLLFHHRQSGRGQLVLRDHHLLHDGRVHGICVPRQNGTRCTRPSLFFWGGYAGAAKRLEQVQAWLVSMLAPDPGKHRGDKAKWGDVTIWFIAMGQR